MCRSVVLHQVQIVPRTTAQRSVPITLSATNNGVCLLPWLPQTTECAYYLGCHKQRSVPITLSDTKMSSDDFRGIIRHGPLALLATRQQVGVWMDR
jgi:hypothetical protein